MFSRSSWLHLRIPFSLFLLPIFIFSLSVSPDPAGPRTAWVLFILHFLLYPASNGYNSYFDKDEKSIGGLENPPPVEKGLYFLALTLDFIAVALALLFVNTTFAAMALTYGLVSKAYSHPAIRLKKYAWTSWLITGLFQGVFTFVMCYAGINDLPFDTVWQKEVVVPGALVSLMLWANYPLTQIYQHEEDLQRGDFTLSARLGVVGTFRFAAAIFTVAAVGFVWYLHSSSGLRPAVLFIAAMLPVLLYFAHWFLITLRDATRADYRHTMRLNFISAICLNGYFIYLLIEKGSAVRFPG